MRSISMIAAGLAVFASMPAPRVAQAAEAMPPASEWRSYCRTYLKALDGDRAAADLDVTYCLGITQGLMSGLQVGSQIGALSFGSKVAVQHKLDPDEIFKLFQTLSPSQLLGICGPAEPTAAQYIRAVDEYLEKNPKHLARPIGEVFFEGLQAAFPCG
ncbi:MAG: acyl-CoA carboxylase subunit epsilon [Lysobacterales bacterium]|nr:MAG: acyl-CoA carboxylase subunit epsilon [Xanthomonadales bacterium]